MPFALAHLFVHLFGFDALFGCQNGKDLGHHSEVLNLHVSLELCLLVR